MTLYPFPILFSAWATFAKHYWSLLASTEAEVLRWRGFGGGRLGTRTPDLLGVNLKINP